MQTGRMAKQANGSIFARCGGVAVLATVCCGDKADESLDFIPLHVEYNEKYYAAGKIPGGFLKREARPKDREILVSRLIDRPIRPLFSKAFKRDIQVIPTVMSADRIQPTDVVAMNAASAAVSISGIPFDGPIGAVRVGYVDGKYIINPNLEQAKVSDLDIIVAGTIDGITMVEGGANQISEDVLSEAIELARQPIAKLCEAQRELRERVATPMLPLVVDEYRLEAHDEIVEALRPKMERACFVKGKMIRRAAINDIIAETRKQFGERIPEDREQYFAAIADELEQDILRRSIVENNLRSDGRKPEDIRPIECEVGILDRAHGSALFTRGETQALAITTLGSVYDEQILDDIEGDRRSSPFMLHYNFPPYSVGETGRLATGRREIGHGNLAYRALDAVLPDREQFPYTIRLVSEVLESNGSSSMATVCGGSLSLMHGGIPIEQPVAGIAMGLVQEGENVIVLSDILGEEDHFGDMDFKVAGTKEGITAFQMDIKIKNVDANVLKKALEQARKGRMHILSVMGQAIEKPQAELSEYAPRIIKFEINPEFIGMLIGAGGKTIKGINERFSVETNIDDSGLVTIYCKNKQNGENARAEFEKLLEEPEIGKIYSGTVKRIVDFGAFIEFLPSKEGLCHISKMSKNRLESVGDLLRLNQVLDVQIIEIDKMGRVNLGLLLDDDDTGDTGNQRPTENRGRPYDRQSRDSRPPRRGGGGGGSRPPRVSSSRSREHRR